MPTNPYDTARTFAEFQRIAGEQRSAIGVLGVCHHVNTITCPNCAPRRSSACPSCTPRCPHGYPADQPIPMAVPLRPQQQPWQSPFFISSVTTNGAVQC